MPTEKLLPPDDSHFESGPFDNMDDARAAAEKMWREWEAAEEMVEWLRAHDLSLDMTMEQAVAIRKAIEDEESDTTTATSTTTTTFKDARRRSADPTGTIGLRKRRRSVAERRLGQLCSDRQRHSRPPRG